MIPVDGNQTRHCIFAPQIKRMKKLITLMFALAVVIIASAQPGKTPVKTIPGKTPAGSLKTINDSASYAIGISVANFYKQNGVPKINTILLSKAINDIYGKKKPLLEEALCNNLMNRYMNTLQEEKSKPAMIAGEQFLAKNKLRPEVKTTASGLQYEIIRDTTGPKPVATDSVTAHYRGTLANGTEFDNSYSRGEPITFALRGVIPGWTEGLQLMSIGSKYKFYVPYTLGYGAFDYGPIPGGSALIFEVELLGIKKVPDAPKQGN
jgi:FKBP-type peptidyl-prolyl cis-trans isomerase FklB